MFDGIPFGGAGGIVCDRNRQAECVAHLRLKFDLPGPGTTTVAAARVRQDQQPWNTAPATRAFAFPPSGNGMDGEGRRIVRNADTNSAAIVQRVVNAGGDAEAAGIWGRVVRVHENRR